MWNGAAFALNPSPTSTSARPARSSTPCASPVESAVRMRSNSSWPAGAVHERRPVEQERGADRADDQILEAALQREQVVGLDGDEHVEADREELERHERRHEAVRHRQQRHARARREQERVVLHAALAQVAHAERDAHGEEPRRRRSASGRPGRRRRSAPCGRTRTGPVSSNWLAETAAAAASAMAAAAAESRRASSPAQEHADGQEHATP